MRASAFMTIQRGIEDGVILYGIHTYFYWSDARMKAAAAVLVHCRR